MREVKQSTAKNYMVFMTDMADHVTGKTGLTLAITASKDGAAFASISPTVTERGSGWYNLALTAAMTDTLGDLTIHITGTGADPTDLAIQVVAYDPNDAAALGLSRLDAVVSTRALETGGNVAAIKAKTDLIGASVALETGGNLAAVKTKTDNLPATPADQTDVVIIRRLLKNKLVIDKATSTLKLYDDAGVSVLYTWTLTDKDGNTVVLTGTGPANRGVPT
jgi:hypothetical protein